MNTTPMTQPTNEKVAREIARTCAAAIDNVIRKASDNDYGAAANWSHNMNESADELTPIIQKAIDQRTAHLREQHQKALESHFKVASQIVEIDQILMEADIPLGPTVEMVKRLREQLQVSNQAVLSARADYQDVVEQLQVKESQVGRCVESIQELIEQYPKNPWIISRFIRLLRELPATPNYVKRVEELEKAYQTVKDWAHRLEGKIIAITDMCEEAAKEEPAGSFPDRLIGMLNDLDLKINPDQPLRAEVQGQRLIISIGLERLAFCAENDDGNPHLKVVSQSELGKDACRAMMAEREDGSTILTDLFDAATTKACEEGSAAFDYNQPIPEPQQNLNKQV